MNSKWGVLFLVLIIGRLTHASSMPFEDQNFECTDNQIAQRYVKDFNINVESFGGLELCNSQVDTKKLFNDLSLVEKGEFEEEKSSPLYRGWIPAKDYYPWMKTMTRGMDRRNDDPTATAYNSGGFFTMQDGWSQSSTLGRVGVVLHEARHTEGYRHIPCTHGPYMATPAYACDASYSYGGSHGFEMEYYARVSTQGKNFHPVYKAMARLMAVARSNFVFNEKVLKEREALLALEKGTQNAYVFDGEQTLLRQPPRLPGAQLKRTSAGASLFTGDKAYSIELYEPTAGVNSEGEPTKIVDAYSYFKLLLDLRQNFKDYEEFDVNEQRFSVALTPKNEVTAYVYGEGFWTEPRALDIDPIRTVTTLENGQRGYFFLTNDGKIHSYNPFTMNVQDLGQQWNSDYLKFARVGDTLYALNRDGKILKHSEGSSWQNFERAETHFDDLVSVPLYDAFEVHR